MTPSNACARSIATALLLLLACAQTACKPSSTRPDSAPTPPSVGCDLLADAMLLPPVPPLADMDAWALEAMAITEATATEIGAMQACMARLREKGVIR